MFTFAVARALPKPACPEACLLKRLQLTNFGLYLQSFHFPINLTNTRDNTFYLLPRLLYTVWSLLTCTPYLHLPNNPGLLP